MIDYEFIKPKEAHWKGPLVDGLTQSLINKFLSCPYRFYLYAILGLEDDTAPHPNLIWGDCYHVGLEHLLPGKDVELAQTKAMERLQEWKSQDNVNKETVPALNMYPISITSMLPLYDLMKMEGPWKTEIVFEHPHDIRGNKFLFKGKMDALSLHNNDLGEHKCKGRIDPELLREEIRDDLQVNLYLKVAESERVRYDLIKIPEVQWRVPYRTKSESDKQYISRLYYGNCGATQDFPVTKNRHAWIHQSTHTIPENHQAQYWKQTIEPLALLIQEWYEYVTSPEFDPTNPDCYNHLFYKVPVRTFRASNTEKFKCDYHAVLTGQESLENLRPVPSYYTELEEC